MAIRVRRNRGPRKFRLFAPHWVDPHPGIPGTEPEKRVFALLVQMKIYFIYQGQVPEFEKGNPMYFLAPPNYKPDFVLPEYRIIIDPFGAFHHSLQGADQKDAMKVARYAAAGYAYYHPWFGIPGTRPGTWLWDQYQVELDPKLLLRAGIRKKRDAYGKNVDRRQRLIGQMNTLEMLMSIPEIRLGPRYPLKDPRDLIAKRTFGYRIGEYLGAGANSVAAANRTRRRPPLLSLQVGQRNFRRRQRM